MYSALLLLPFFLYMLYIQWSTVYTDQKAAHVTLELLITFALIRILRRSFPKPQYVYDTHINDTKGVCLAFRNSCLRFPKNTLFKSTDNQTRNDYNDIVTDLW